VFKYNQSLLLGSFVEVVCCDIFYAPLHSVNGKLFFCGAPFLWCVQSIIQSIK